jgi:hypothetical protein
MNRFAEPHDLDALCASCGTTVREVSERTGISLDRLRSFAAARCALRADERLALLVELGMAQERECFAQQFVEHATQHSLGEALEKDYPLREAPLLDEHATRRALKVLMDEVEDEALRGGEDNVRG